MCEDTLKAQKISSPLFFRHPVVVHVGANKLINIRPDEKSRSTQDEEPFMPPNTRLDAHFSSMRLRIYSSERCTFTIMIYE